MLNTNSNIYKAAIKQHIIDCTIEYCIESTGNEKPTDKEVLEYVFSEFNRVANHKHNLRRIPNTQNRLADYLQGLPFHFPWHSDGMIEAAEEAHNCKLTEKQGVTVVKNYYNHIAFHIIRAGEKEGVDFLKY